MAACTSGGYDCQFVDIPLDANVIVRSVSREPQMTMCCGHTFASHV